jgi:hypothetical protein
MASHTRVSGKAGFGKDPGNMRKCRKRKIPDTGKDTELYHRFFTGSQAEYPIGGNQEN